MMLLYGAVESAHLSRPPPEDSDVRWVCWPKAEPDRRVEVRARLWFDARAEARRVLGTDDVDGELLR